KSRPFSFRTFGNFFYDDPGIELYRDARRLIFILDACCLGRNHGGQQPESHDTNTAQMQLHHTYLPFKCVGSCEPLFAPVAIPAGSPKKLPLDQPSILASIPPD